KASPSPEIFRNRRAKRRSLGLPRFLPREGLPTHDRDGGVVLVDLDAEASPASALAGDQGAAGAEEQVQDEVAGLAAVVQGALNQGQRLGRGVQVRDRGAFDLPQVALIAVTLPVVFHALTPAVPQGLVLPLVICPAQDKAVLGPDDRV